MLLWSWYDDRIFHEISSIYNGADWFLLFVKQLILIEHVYRYVNVSYDAVICLSIQTYGISSHSDSEGIPRNMGEHNQILLKQNPSKHKLYI